MLRHPALHHNAQDLPFLPIVLSVRIVPWQPTVEGGGVKGQVKREVSQMCGGEEDAEQQTETVTQWTW